MQAADYKPCVQCGRPFARNPRYSARQWEGARFCTRACAIAWRRERQPPPPTTIEPTVGTDRRFWAYVSVGALDECWEWKRRRHGFGYGKLSVGGREFGAHRVAYTLAVRPIPDGLCVLHHCDNPACCNPSHLFLGTKRANIVDMHAKGRGNIGAINGAAKLDDAKVAEIRRRVRDGEAQKALCAEFGIDSSTMSVMVNRKTWRHVA